MAKKSNLVRYRVVAPVYVNDVLYDPKKTKDGAPLFVMAAPGLEGRALKLAPKTGDKAKNGDKPQQGDQGEPTAASGDDSAAGK